MTLSDGDKAIVREIAFEVGRVLKADLKDSFDTQINLHTANCPIKVQVEQVRGGWKAMAAVAGIIAAIAGMMYAVVFTIREFVGKN